MVQVSKYDFVTWLATFLCCLLISIDVGLGVGLLLALLFLFTQMAFPTVGALGRIPGMLWLWTQVDACGHQTCSNQCWHNKRVHSPRENTKRSLIHDAA